MSKLSELQGNKAAVTSIERAVQTLKDVGFIEFMREQARPIIVNQGKDITIMASQASHSAGYNNAVDDMLNFTSRYIIKSTTPNELIADYGGVERAIERGHISQEEADEYRKQLRLQGK